MHVKEKERYSFVLKYCVCLPRKQIVVLMVKIWKLSKSVQVERKLHPHFIFPYSTLFSKCGCQKLIIV